MRTYCSSSRLLGGGVCLSACWDTPQVLAWRPPSVGLETPPQGVGLETSPGVGLKIPLGVGLETLPGQTPQLPPWVWAWRPAMHARIPPPCEQSD